MLGTAKEYRFIVQGTVTLPLPSSAASPVIEPVTLTSLTSKEKKRKPANYMAKMEKLKEFFGSKYFSDPKIIATSAGVALLAYYLMERRQIDQFKKTFARQSLELPGPEHVRVNAHTPNLVKLEDCKFKTIYEIFMTGVSHFGDGPFLGTRADANSEYKWETYNEIYEKAQYLGSALYELGFRKGGLIGISGKNRPEWVIVDQGAMMFSMVLVPMYDTLGQEGLRHIMRQTEMSIVFCDVEKLENFLNNAEQTKFLKTIITFDKVTDEELIARCQKNGIHLVDMKTILDLGKDHPHEKVLPTPEDLALICYTSGTTGNPKGVMVTHSNMAVTVHVMNSGKGEVSDDSDVHMSYLPLSHMYERSVQYVVMYVGGRIGFYRGNVKELIKDIQALRPTIFLAVPRILNVLYDKIMNEVSGSFVKSLIMKLALAAKSKEVSRGIMRKDSFWDRLVFNKVQNILGGRVKLIASGAAPLSANVKLFFKCAFGCSLVEGYGQTEGTALMTSALGCDPSLGHVGPPAPHCRIKLVDVPDLDYFAEDGKGEICVQGPGVFSGYFKDPEKTKEAFDEEGWLHTGDIGKWSKSGTLSIIDRKKHIFKLAQGEYIAPEKIELVYLRSPLVAQIFVTGHSNQTCTVAIVCPEEDMLNAWAKKHHISGSFADLCSNETMRQAILESVREVGAAGGLNSLEQVKAVHLTHEAFSIENGLLTPTMKAKRKQIEEKFSEEVKFLYETLSSTK